MSNLGPEAQDLIRAGRSALKPTGADRARIAQALRARIEGASGGLSAASASAAGKSHWLAWSTLSAVVVGLGAGGLLVTGAWSNTQSPAASSPAAVVSAASPLAAAPAEKLVPPSSNEPDLAAERPSTEEPQARSAKRPSDRLAEEVAILSRAETELHAKRFASALSALEEHGRKFPRGALAQERRAARVRALCGLGRTAEADAELARLSPGSLHEGSTRAACAATRKTLPD